jgi:hypothetical protein
MGKESDMRWDRRRAFVVLLAATLGTPGPCGAGEACCAQCGRWAPCEKACRLVESEKQVEVVCWGARREEFCIPGPSKLVGVRREAVCAACEIGEEGEGVSSQPRRRVWFDWRPGCAKIQVRTKLMKRVETKSVPVREWAAVDLCPECRARPPAAARLRIASASP